jgi:hypothetical protein
MSSSPCEEGQKFLSQQYLQSAYTLAISFFFVFTGFSGLYGGDFQVCMCTNLHSDSCVEFKVYFSNLWGKVPRSLYPPMPLVPNSCATRIVQVYRIYWHRSLKFTLWEPSAWPSCTYSLPYSPSPDHSSSITYHLRELSLSELRRTYCISFAVL